jgi:hypothetical protein
LTRAVPLLATPTLPGNVMTRDSDQDELIVIFSVAAVALCALIFIIFVAMPRHDQRSRESLGEIPQSPGNFAAER